MTFLLQSKEDTFNFSSDKMIILANVVPEKVYDEQVVVDVYSPDIRGVKL